jgi:hypothetical protein
MQHRFSSANATAQVRNLRRFSEGRTRL